MLDVISTALNPFSSNHVYADPLIAPHDVIGTVNKQPYRNLRWDDILYLLRNPKVAKSIVTKSIIAAAIYNC